jgi:hypothetical protein
MENIKHEISLYFDTDKRVVNAIVNHPLKFLRDKVSGDDIRPVRIRYFGVFCQKGSKFNKVRAASYRVRSLLNTYSTDCVEYLHLNSKDEVVKYLEDMFMSSRYNDIDEFYKKIYDYRRRKENGK